MVLTRRAVPSVADARRAALTLVTAGAGRVVLFGSVARGEATERSDIDLVAIYDDIDYSHRGHIADRLTTAAAAAAGYPVDVLVTDRPEWRMRTTRVRTSLEARARRSGLVLADRDAGTTVEWGKEMVMPDSDYQEGLYRLNLARRQVTQLEPNLTRSPAERYAAEAGNTLTETLAEIDRMLLLGGRAHSVTENAIKALIHVTRNTAAEQCGHNIAELCDQLPPQTRKFVQQLMQPLTPEAITPWQRWERYHRRGRDADPRADVVGPLVQAACRVATYAADQFGHEPTAGLIRETVARIDAHLTAYDLTSGVMLPPDVGGESRSTADLPDPGL